MAFTEHGTVMAANVLNSELAIDTSLLIVRAFIQIRELLFEHTDLKQRLDKLESRIAKKFSENEEELQEIRFIIQKLEAPLEIKKASIGFRPQKTPLYI